MMDNDYHQVEDRTKPGTSAPIILEKNVWLGVRVVVLKGVRIGENSVIGANSVVSRDIPPNCLAGGVPARIIRTFSGQE
jgi:acetyltransferase-like isoleucine patch superfamily enzyme